MDWIDGKPTKPGLCVIEWRNGPTDPEVRMVAPLIDGKLYLLPFGVPDSKEPYPLDKSAITRHIYLPQPPGDGINTDWHTTDFDPVTCEWVSPNGEREHPRFFDPSLPPLPDIQPHQSLTDWLKVVEDFLQAEKQENEAKSGTATEAAQSEQ